MTEEEIKESGEAIAKELDGKSKEELEAMERNANEEIQKQILRDACTYIWNLMGPGGEFTEEAYTKFVNETVAKNNAENRAIFTRWDEQMFSLNRTIIAQGYGHFGNDFINTILEKDRDSALVIFETAVQAYLDIRYDYEDLLNAIVGISQVKEQESKENK